MFAFWLLFAPENGLFSGRWLVGRGSPGSLLLRGSRTSWWVGWGQCVCVFLSLAAVSGPGFLANTQVPRTQGLRLCCW